MNKKHITQYVVVLYTISWLIQIVSIILTKGENAGNIRMVLLSLAMLTPAIITLFFFKRNTLWKKDFLWRPNGKIFLMSFISITVPIFIALSVVALILSLKWGSHPWFSFSTEGVNLLGGPWILGKGQNTWIFFIANIFFTGILYSFFNGLIAVGEELAWRGFLQNVLIDKLGTVKGIILLGLLWSFWHLPVFLAGHNEPEYPILGTFIIGPIRLVALSFFWAWLTLTCRSFIPAALAHGALNSIQEGIISNIHLSVPTLYKDLITLTLTVGLGFLSYFLLKTRKHVFIKV
jgi:uncharacterized protein